MNKMLLIYFVILTLIVNQIQGAAIQEEVDDNTFTERLARFFTRRCLKNENQEQLQELLSKLKDLQKCFLKILPKHTDEDYDNLEGTCFETTDEVTECMKKLVEAFKPCLEPEESYVPEFVMESFRNYTDYLCKHADILTINGLLDSKMAKCINRFMKHKNTNPHNICYAALQISVESRETAITKDELCHDLDLVYLCYKAAFTEKCPDAPKAWEFQAGLINGMRSPCPKVPDSDPLQELS